MKKWLQTLFEYKMAWQVGLAVVIASLPGMALTYFIVHEYRFRELSNLQVKFQSEMARIGGPFTSETLKTLDQTEINRLMENFEVQMFWGISFFGFLMGFGAMISFYFLVGRHLNRLSRLNQRTKQGQLVLYPESLIPENELGTILRTHNSMLVEQQSHRDILERNLSEARASVLHAAKLSALGELTASISHDLKNPLSVILGFVELSRIHEERGSFDRILFLDYMKKIGLAAERISRMVSEMNRFARKDVSLADGNSLEKTIQNVCLFLGNKIADFRIEVVLKLEEGLSFYGDPGAIEQVLMNLIGNACDAMESSSQRKLEITTWKEANCAMVSIKDSGSGISKEHLEKIFTAFFTTKKSGRGTGLGLSICQHIVAEHHGELTVQSTAGAGTEFKVRLLINAPAAADPGSSGDQNIYPKAA